MTNENKPFLKWPGGKYKLISKIADSLPSGQRFYEPFVGGGAVFSNLEYPKFTISDANPDLINLYKQFKKEGLGFIDYCHSFFGSAYNRPEIYYALRLLFNASNEPREKAAIFLYLNRHSFNGLIRYNRSGGFNAPFGSYKKPYFPRKEMEIFLPKLRRATIKQGDYKKVIKNAAEGDVCYFDPPYAPLNQKTNFTQYAAGVFGYDDQEELARIALNLSERGVSVLVSNHDTPYTRNLYSAAKFTTFEVQRNISCDGKKREKAKELLAFFERK